MYILVFILLLWTLFQVVLSQVEEKPSGLDGPEGSFEMTPPCEEDLWSYDKQNTLFLIKPNKSDSHVSLNNLFVKYIRLDHTKSWNIAYVNCNSSKLLDIIQYTMNEMKLRYVIYLNASDFYQTNYNDIKNSGFFWAGNINSLNEPLSSVCQNTTRTRKWEMETVEICEPFNETIKATVVVSEEVLENSFLVYLINMFCNAEYETYVPYEPYTVLICSDTDHEIEDINAGKNVEINFKNGCSLKSTNDNQVIAIVAPNSNKIEETSKPVIFFDQDIPEDQAAFPNAMYLKSSQMRSYKNLAKYFTWFIREMRWGRVAVLSDDSKESIEFEEHLKSELKMAASWLSYTTREVTETSHGYDFTEALASLQHKEARIIIVNVAERHAVKMAEDAYKITMRSQTVWIARQWSKQTVSEAMKYINTVYSVLVMTNLKPTTKAIQATNTIRDTISDTKIYDFLNHSQFARDIRKNLDCDWYHQNNTYVYHQTRGMTQNELIAKDRVFQKSKVEKPLDRFTACTLKSLNFDRHCDDMVLIYILLVIAVFAITVLGITYFFTTPDTNYNRMRN